VSARRRRRCAPARWSRSRSDAPARSPRAPAGVSRSSAATARLDPADETPVGASTRHAVGRQPLDPLETPQRRVREPSEPALQRPGPEARPAQPALQGAQSAAGAATLLVPGAQSEWRLRRPEAQRASGTRADQAVHRQPVRGLEAPHGGIGERPEIARRPGPAGSRVRPAAAAAAERSPSRAGDRTRPRARSSAGHLVGAPSSSLAARAGAAGTAPPGHVAAKLIRAQYVRSILLLPRAMSAGRAFRRPCPESEPAGASRAARGARPKPRRENGPARAEAGRATRPSGRAWGVPTLLIRREQERESRRRRRPVWTNLRSQGPWSDHARFRWALQKPRPARTRRPRVVRSERLTLDLGNSRNHPRAEVNWSPDTCRSRIPTATEARRSCPWPARWLRSCRKQRSDELPVHDRCPARPAIVDPPTRTHLRPCGGDSGSGPECERPRFRRPE
jgi:hypothetical protein